MECSSFQLGAGYIHRVNGKNATNATSAETAPVKNDLARINKPLALMFYNTSPGEKGRAIKLFQAHRN